MGEPASEATFGDRLREACERYGPLCAASTRRRPARAWGRRHRARRRRVRAALCEAFAGHVAIVKPQVAFFERHGSREWPCSSHWWRPLARPVARAVRRKARDIDSTCEAYADAWLSPRSALAGDAVTASAYLGFDAWRRCSTPRGARRAVFVVARSSNPRGADPIARSASGSTVDDDLLASVAGATHVARRCRWRHSIGAPAPSSARRSSRPSSTCAASRPILAPDSARKEQVLPDRRALRGCCPGPWCQRVALGPGQRAV